MNIFNRIVVVLALIINIVLAVFLIVYPVTAINALRYELDLLEQVFYSDRSFFIFYGAMGLCILVSLVLLILELRRSRKKTVKIRTEGGGRAELGVESVKQSLEYRIDELAGVREVKAKIISRGRDVRVIINLHTSPSVNIPVLTGQIMDLSRDILEGQLGVRIRGKVRVNVKHEPYPRGTMPPTGPLPEKGEAIATPPTMAPARQAQPEEAAKPAEAASADVQAVPSEREATVVEMDEEAGGTVPAEGESAAEDDDLDADLEDLEP